MIYQYYGNELEVGLGSLDGLELSLDLVFEVVKI
jgi:hypothetical protein